MYPWIHIGSIALPSYFIMISLACVVGMFWLVKRAEKMNLPPERALDLAMVIMVFGFIGARVAHIVIEEPGYYLAHPASTLFFWEGGFVFYGGAILAFLASWTWAAISQRSKNPKRRFQLREGWLDLFAPVLALAYAIGRIGCFMAGCCYGKACELPWAVTFPAGVEAPAHIARHPTQLYAVTGEIIAIAFLLLLERRHPKRGVIFSTYVMLHSISRIIMEVFRDDDRGPVFFGSFTISMIMSAGAFLVGTFLLFQIIRTESRDNI